MKVREFINMTYADQMIKIIDKKAFCNNDLDVYEESILAHDTATNIPEEYLDKDIIKIDSYMDMDDGLDIIGQGIHLYI